METKKLESVFLQTSTGCNVRCVICPYQEAYGKKPVKYMTERLFNKILRDLKDFDGEIGFYFQYEPLLDSRLNAFLKLAKEKCPKAYLSVSTNLSLYRNLEDCDYIYFNILGGTKETYEKMMPPLKWETMLKNVKKYSENFKGVMYVNFMKTNENVGEIENLRKVLPKNIEIITRYWASNRGGKVKINKPEYSPTRFLKDEKDCEPIGKRVYIYYDGKVPICCQCWEREVIVGDVIEENIIDIFNKPKSYNHDICRNCD